MDSFQKSMIDYKKQLQKGTIKEAYKGLMDYIMNLRTHFQTKFPDYVVSGSIYFGYMDMTYFSFFPKSLKNKQLKVAVVFVHDTFRFEAWLAGYNKAVQAKYWKLFKESGWDKYHVVSSPKGVDSIVEYVLVDDPDFGDLEALTRQIEAGTLQFIRDVEGFLSKP